MASANPKKILNSSLGEIKSRTLWEHYCIILKV